MFCDCLAGKRRIGRELRNRYLMRVAESGEENEPGLVAQSGEYGSLPLPILRLASTRSVHFFRNPTVACYNALVPHATTRLRLR